MLRFFFVLFALGSLAPVMSVAQGQDDEPKLSFKVTGAFQFWTVLEHGQEVWNKETKSYEAQDSRLLLMMRRARLGGDFKYGTRVKARITAELDQLGPPIQGNPDTQSPSDLGVLDAFVVYHVSQSELLYVTAGYFRPQISRESITSAFAVPSMEKSFAQSYPRKFLTGNSFGRAAGLEFGGLFPVAEHFHVRYDGGLFAPGNSYDLDTISGPEWRNDLMISGRVEFWIGDPETRTFGLGHRINYFGKRRGISVAVQGATTSGIGGARQLFGIDFLANSGPWQLDGEWLELHGNSDASIFNRTGHLRLSFNHPFESGHVLQPFLMYGYFFGPMDGEGQALAAAQGMLSGESFQYSGGIIYHIRPGRLWLTAQYTVSDGRKGDAADGNRINYYYDQSGLGAIHRGDWAGIGIHLSFM